MTRRYESLPRSWCYINSFLRLRQCSAHEPEIGLRPCFPFGRYFEGSLLDNPKAVLLVYLKPKERAFYCHLHEISRCLTIMSNSEKPYHDADVPLRPFGPLNRFPISQGRCRRDEIDGWDVLLVDPNLLVVNLYTLAKLDCAKDDKYVIHTNHGSFYRFDSGIARGKVVSV